jgi:cobalt/nickel transport system permease protein
MGGGHGLELSGVAGVPTSNVHALDPRAKLLGLLTVTAVAVSTPLAAWPAYFACAAVLLVVALAARIPPGLIWRRARIVLLPVLAVALTVPFVRTGGATAEIGPLTAHEAGAAVMLAVALKAAIGVTSAVLLGATTAVPDLLRALERLRLPRLLVLIAALMHRYAFVLAAEARSMRAALAARGWRPRTALQAGAAGRVAGSLFVRSYMRGERVHRAMLARGFAGSIPRVEPLAFARADLAFVALLLLAVVPVRIAAGLA